MKWKAWLEIRGRYLDAGMLAKIAGRELNRMDHKCEVAMCQQEAVYYYRWPGSDEMHHVCEAHAVAIKALAHRMHMWVHLVELWLPAKPRSARPVAPALPGPTPPAIEPPAGKPSEAGVEGLSDEERRFLLRRF